MPGLIGHLERIGARVPSQHRFPGTIACAALAGEDPGRLQDSLAAHDRAAMDASRWIGDVDTATLQDVAIDNNFFGLAAVAKDGSESPVVFPGAAGRFGG